MENNTIENQFFPLFLDFLLILAHIVKASSKSWRMWLLIHVVVLSLPVENRCLTVRQLQMSRPTARGAALNPSHLAS